MKKIKIMYPQVGSRIGGSVKSAANIALSFEEVDKVEVVFCTPNKNEAYSFFKELQLNTISLDIKEARVSKVKNTKKLQDKIISIYSHYIFFTKAKKILKECKPHVLHINDDSSVWAWGLAAKIRKIPVIWHIRQEKESKADKVRMLLVNYIIFISEYNKSRFRDKVVLQPNSVIPNGIEVGSTHIRINKKNNKVKTVTFVGNLIPRKRPEWFIKTAVEVLKVRDDVIFQIVGDDPYQSFEREYSQLIPQELQEKIIFLGFRKDVENILDKTDILALTSEEGGEAFPRVILEAMKTSTAVVATKVAAIPEEVENEITGYLVSANDRNEFYEKIMHLLSDENKIKEMGIAGRQKLEEEFNSRNLSSKYLEVYDLFNM